MIYAERLALFAAIILATCASALGLISIQLQLLVQVAVAAYATGLMVESGRSARRSIQNATAGMENFICLVDEALEEGSVPEEQVADMEADLARAQRTLAFLDSMGSWRERRRRRRAHHNQ